MITQLREILGDSLADWPLVRLRGGVVPENGIMHTTVDRLVDPLEHRALRLVPLVRMMAGPEDAEDAEDAWYYFGRLENGTIRWLSYHHTNEASRQDMDPATAVLISEITTKPPRDPAHEPAPA